MIPVGIIAGVFGGAWAAGLLDDAPIHYVSAVSGETVDMGPLEFTPFQAKAYPSTLDDSVKVVIEAECRNKESEELSTYDVQRVGLYLYHPTARDATGLLAPESKDLRAGSWERYAISQPLNPLDHPVKCQLSGTFEQYPETDQVRLVVLAIEPYESPWSTVESAAYVSRQDVDPREFYLPLTVVTED